MYVLHMVQVYMKLIVCVSKSEEEEAFIKDSKHIFSK